MTCKPTVDKNFSLFTLDAEDIRAFETFFRRCRYRSGSMHLAGQLSH
jgi:hypothetical protein